MTDQLSVRRIACVVVAGVVALSTLSIAQTPAPAPLPSDALFESDVLNRLDLRLNSIDWEKLKQNFQTNAFYPADVVFKGQTAYNVGIRSRGLGSRSPTKPGIRIDINHYTDGETYYGVTGLILDNLVQDPSAIHETVTMKLFAKMGIPAPREAHVRLYINNQYSGVYALVEEVNKQFLARVFGSIGDDVQNDGGLFEFNYIDPWQFGYLGPDLNAYKARFDPKTEENKPDQEKFGPIETLVRLANDLPANQFLSGLGDRLDLLAFMKYVGAQNFVSQNDGFLGYAGMNNFYFYRLENTLRHVFIAWDEDNAFAFIDFPLTMRHDENVLMRKAMQVPELRDAYYNGLTEAMRFADEATGPDRLTWLEFEVRRQTDLIADALRDDPVKPYTFDEHQNARVAMIQFAQGRSRFVHDALQAGSQSLRRPD